jgi:hypothetical protein
VLHVYRGGHRLRLCGARHWRGRLGVEALEEIPKRTLLGYIEGDFLTEDEAAAARQVCVWCVHVGVTCGRGAGLICCCTQGYAANGVGGVFFRIASGYIDATKRGTILAHMNHW